MGENGSSCRHRRDHRRPFQRSGIRHAVTSDNPPSHKVRNDAQLPLSGQETFGRLATNDGPFPVPLSSARFRRLTSTRSVKIMPLRWLDGEAPLSGLQQYDVSGKESGPEEASGHGVRHTLFNWPIWILRRGPAPQPEPVSLPTPGAYSR